MPTAAVEQATAGYRMTLDDKPVRTPARRELAAPTLALAQAIAAEWAAQRELIDPAKMPLTRLANAIIDGVADSPGPVAAEIEKYLASDLLFYRASSPQQLRERQAAHWDPILGLGARLRSARTFKAGEGVVHVAQPEAALNAAAAAIPNDPWRLGAMHVVTTLTGSALIALAHCCAARCPPRRRGRRRMSTRTGIWSNGARTNWRCSAARSALPSLRRRRWCSILLAE